MVRLSLKKYEGLKSAIQIAEMPFRSEVFVGLQEKRCYSKVSLF